MRMPNTAITMPQVRNRPCHTGSIWVSTAALTTALSNDSDTSRTPSTSTIHTTPAVAATDPVSNQP